MPRHNRLRTPWPLPIVNGNSRFPSLLPLPGVSSFPQDQLSTPRQLQRDNTRQPSSYLDSPFISWLMTNMPSGILNFSPPLGKSTHERNSPKQNQLSTQSQPTTLCGPFSTFSFRHFASSYPAFSFQTSSSHAIPESSVHKLVEISLPAFQPCSRKTPSSHLHRLPHVWSSSSSGWFFQS